MHIKEGQITRKFDDLVEMHLIEKVGKETRETIKKIKVTADIYEYTKQGILILLIIKSNNDGEERIYSTIYNILDSLLMKRPEPPHMNVFYFSLFKRSKRSKLFQILVQKMYNVLDTNNSIQSISDLLAYTITSVYPDSKTQRQFFRLWKKTIEELESDGRQIVMYQMKLLAEQRFQNANAPLSKAYEKIRFQYRAKFEYIIVGGNCNKCGYYDAIPLNYIEYIRSITNSNDILKKVECKRCNAKQGILIPKF